MDQFWDILEQIGDWLGVLGKFFAGAAAVLAGIATALEAILAISAAAAAVIAVIVAAVGAIVTLIVSVAMYVFTAYPYYKLGKRAGVKFAWLAWVPIPVADFCCRLYVLSQIPGEKRVSVFGSKLGIPNRFLVFWGYMGIRFLGLTALTMIITVVSPILIAIPFVGEVYLLLAPILGPIIMAIPAVLVAFLEFAFLYDAVSTFKGQTLSNLILSIVVTVIDNVFTLNLPIAGLATTIYLYSLLKQEAAGNRVPLEAELLYETDAVPALDDAQPEALPEDAVDIELEAEVVTE